MANKHMKWRAIYYIISKILIQEIVRYYHTPIRRAKIKNTDNAKHWQGWQQKFLFIVSTSSVSHLVVSDSVNPQTVARRAPLSIGVDCHSLFQRIFLTKESNQVSCIAGRFFFYCLSYKGFIIIIVSGDTKLYNFRRQFCSFLQAKHTSIILNNSSVILLFTPWRWRFM